MDNNLSVLAGRLREFRKAKKWTLQKLAEKTALTAGLLSKIENLRTVPSLPVLISLAAALEVELQQLFGEAATAGNGKKWLHIRKADFKPIDREENSGFTYELLLESRLSGDRQQVMLVTVAPGAKRPMVSGDGNEILYLVSGNLAYQIGNDRLDFREGEVLFFDSSQPHGPCNDGDVPAILLAVYHLHEPIF